MTTTDFSQRLAAQRRIVQNVNCHISLDEPLCSLSGAAIQRWCDMNSIQSTSTIAGLLRSVGTALQFIATRSQQAIDDETGLPDIALLESRVRDELAGFTR